MDVGYWTKALGSPWVLGTSAVAVLAVAVDPPPYSSIGIYGLLLGTMLLVGAALRQDSETPLAPATWLIVGWGALAVGLFAISVGLLDPFFLFLPGADWIALWFGALLTIVGLAWLGYRSDSRRDVVLGAAVAVAWVVFLGAVVIGQGFPEIDVLHLHHQAADVLAVGGNPFADLNYYETLPWGRGEDITGYTYPPFTMVLYTLGVWIADDARWVNIVALVIAIVMLVGLGWRRHQSVGAVGLSATAVVLAQPTWPTIVYLGWTEPVTVPFLYGAAWLWSSNPILAGVLFGFGLATKQYFLLLLPMLFLGGPLRVKRSIAAVLASGLTAVPWLIADPAALFDSVVVHHLTRASRPDAGTIAGLGIVVPGWIPVGLALLLCVYLARRIRNGSDMLISAAAVVAVFTALASRGFVNSWWLVGMLTIGGLTIRWRESMHNQDSDRTSDGLPQSDQTTDVDKSN